MLSILIDFIQSKDGINDKNELIRLVQYKFSCIKDGTVYYNSYFAIRFSKSKNMSFSNTVLSLSKLQKFDDKPFIVCQITPNKNKLFLANSTFLKKISHSSHNLRIDNIKGSFNGTDIIECFDQYNNTPSNFDVLYAIHQNNHFEENLIRLVDATNGIESRVKKYDIYSPFALDNIMDSPNRAKDFSESSYFSILHQDLDQRTRKFENEILIASCIENNKIRGDIIEYIIASDDDYVREKLIKSLTSKSDTPEYSLQDGLGDFVKQYPGFHTETDIKTKIMVLTSAPKGYNLDKMLEFLAYDDSVFMLYLVGIDFEKRIIKTKLISMFHDTLLNGTVVQAHWSGRNSRGCTQFNGEIIKEIILKEENNVCVDNALRFLNRIINL